MTILITKSKMALSNPVPSGFSTETPTLSTQRNETLRLILGNCTELLQYTTTSVNNTFNYVCEQWCAVYDQPTVTCCNVIHALATNNDVMTNQEPGLSFEENLEIIYDVITKYRSIIKNMTLDAEKHLCQIHWSRGLHCVYPRSCVTATENAERRFCYFQTLKLNMDSLWLLLKDALALLHRDSPVTSSTQFPEPDGEMTHSLNELINLSRALSAIKKVTSSLKALQAN